MLYFSLLGLLIFYGTICLHIIIDEVLMSEITVDFLEQVALEEYTSEGVYNRGLKYFQQGRTKSIKKIQNG